MSRQKKNNKTPAYQTLERMEKMEEKSLRVVGTDKTFFNRLTSTLTKFLIPTQIGINGIKISMKRSALIKAYEVTEEDLEPNKKEIAEKNMKMHIQHI